MAITRPLLPPKRGYVEVEVDGVRTYRNVETGVLIDDEVPYVPETPAEKRENAYNTEQIVEWEGTYITVTEASQKWQYYAAEGSYKADELQALISAAKAEIRAMYPDEEVTV